jgi:hypothetical protein
MTTPRSIFVTLCVAVPVACTPSAEKAPTAAAVVKKAPEPPPAEPPSEAVVEIDGADVVIRAAVTALPPDLREGAAVRAFDSEGALVLVRRGSNDLTCLADDPSDDRFQVACYHDSLEPYMARGRELRAAGVAGPDNLQQRHDEVDAGTLAMPASPASVYTMGGDTDAWDPVTGEVDETKVGRVYSIYMAGATEASTGLSTTPLEAGAPWIMRPGTPSSHVMVVRSKPVTESEDDG